MTERKDAYMFRPSNESKQYMDQLRKTVDSHRQTDLPQIRGIAFFGSRAKGLDNQGSDLDTAVFFNSHIDEVKVWHRSILDKAHEQSHNTPLQGKELSSLFRDGINSISSPEINKIILDHTARYNFDFITSVPRFSENYLGELRNHIIRSFENDFKQLGIPFDEHKTILATDLNIASTNDVLARFITRVNRRQIGSGYFDNAEGDLAIRFFHGFGDELYQNREYILDYFRQIQNGEYYFQALMSYLLELDQATVAKKKATPLPQDFYPKTLDDAYERFIISPKKTETTSASV